MYQAAAIGTMAPPPHPGLDQTIGNVTAITDLPDACAGSYPRVLKVAEVQP